MRSVGFWFWVCCVCDVCMGVVFSICVSLGDEFGGIWILCCFKFAIGFACCFVR